MYLGLRNEGESTTTGIDDSCAMVINCDVRYSISAALKWGTSSRDRYSGR